MMNLLRTVIVFRGNACTTSLQSLAGEAPAL